MTNRRPLPKVLTEIVVGLATVTLLLTSAAPMASAAPFAYMANQGSNSVSVVDAAQPNNVYTLSNITDPLWPFSAPTDVAVNPAGTHAYVANLGDHTVSVIKTEIINGAVSHTVVKKIDVGMSPVAVAVHPTGSPVYVANGDGTISVIDASDLTVKTPMTGFGALLGMAINRAGTRLYVTDGTANSVVSIDLTSPGSRVYFDLASAPVSLVNPMGIAVNPAGTRLYVTASDTRDDGYLAVINTSTNTIEKAVLVGYEPTGVAVNPSGSLVYVTSKGDSVLYVVYARRAHEPQTQFSPIIDKVDFASAYGVALDPTGEYIFVGHAGPTTGRVSIMNTAHTVIASSEVGKGPASIGAFASGGLLPAGPSGPSGDAALQKLLDEANAQVATLLGQLTAASAAYAKLQAAYYKMEDAYNEAIVTIAMLRDQYQQSSMTLASFIRRLMTGRTDENVALAARDAAQQQLQLASARMGTRDARVRQAQKHMNKGLAQLHDRHYHRAVKEFAEAYETCWRLHW